MVAEAANKIKEGMEVGKKGKQKSRPKQIKYTIAFDGTLPCLSDIYTKQEALSEDKTIAPVVFKNSLKHQNAIFVFDKGVQKRSSFTKMENKKICFVTKLKLDSRYKVIEELEYSKDEDKSCIKIISDQKVNLGKPNSSKYLEEKFRIIATFNEKTNKRDLILTNIFNKTPQEIIIIYKKRVLCMTML